uniref:Integrase, catalytic region, zinc finger, CCHC-type, peptidase aspartic, catalytic n=1 Tax=Tanacetum cinerariifolium TaxID=118510 RepID=A0A6L2NVF1_TANCI|nr:hypothetical protein [Tanacetum cinerariifolium]
MIPMSMTNMRINTKFANHLQAEWSRQFKGYAGNAGKNQALGARVVNTVGNTGTNQPRVIRCYNCYGEADSLEETNDCEDLQLQATTNFKADHVDVYDSDYDDEATTNAIFMANLSPVGSINDDMVEPRYDSEILSEVPHYDTYHESNVLNSDKQELEYIENIVSNSKSYDELTSNGNVISYADYMVTIGNDEDNYVPPHVKNNYKILFVIEHMKTQVEKCNMEHVATLHELLEEARALKPLDEHMGHASKFAEQIQELLVYVSAPCLFTQIENEKWALTTRHKKNNKPYVDASRTKHTIETITQKHAVKQNTQKTDNTMLPSTGRLCYTNASRLKPRSNTKNDRIHQTSSRSKKYKVEPYHRRNGLPGLNKENSRAKVVEEGNKHHTKCNKDGHTREGCFKLISYPEWWPGKKGEKTKGKAACTKIKTGPIPELTYVDCQLFVKYFSGLANRKSSKPTTNIDHNENVLINKKEASLEEPVVFLTGESIPVKGKGDHTLLGGAKMILLISNAISFR